MKLWFFCAVAVLTGCAASRPWTLPADLSQGDAGAIVADAAAHGALGRLLAQAEFTVLDSDEERMAELLRAALASGKLSDSERSTAEWMLHDVCELNAPGSVAADFRFSTPSAADNSLLTFLPGEPLLLLLYDPDCSHCREVIAALGALPRLPRVLAVCVEASPGRWEQTRDALPAEWVRAYDRSEVLANDIYVVRALPSLYLLDGERRVVLKNPSVEKLAKHLSR